MQDHGGSVAETAVTSGERSFHVNLLVDWNRNGLYDHELSDMSRFVSSATVDRALQGSSPPELGYVSGSAAAELSVSLAGEDSSGRNLASIFSPYQINSPFWTLEPVGCEIKYQIGIDCGGIFGVVWYPQFVGNIRTVSPDRGALLVHITALDRVEALRKPVLFPTWAVSETHVADGRLLAQLMESQYIIDHALRHCDCSTSPYRPITAAEVGDGSTTSGTQVFITGNGGKVATVGWEDNPNRQEYPDTEHGVLMYEAIGQTHPSAPYPDVKPKVFAAVGNRTDSDALFYWVRDRATINGKAANVSGFTLIKDIGQEASYYLTMPLTEVVSFRTNNEVEIQIWMEAGELWSEWDRQGPTPAHFTSPSVTIPAEDIVDVHVCWDTFHPSGPHVYVQAGSVNTGVVDLGAPFSYLFADDELAGLVEVGRQVAMQDIYLTTTNWGSIGTGLAYKPKPAKYAASLDPGLNRLSFIPVRDKPEAWELIKSVANAEMGSVFWDEEGRFVFWNFDTLQNKRNEIVREVVLDDLQSLDITRTLDSVRNVYAMDQSKGRSVMGTIYVSQDVDEFYVPAGTRKEFRLFVDRGVSPTPSLMPRYKVVSSDPPQTFTDDTIHGYVFQWFNGTSWNEAVTGAFNGVDITAYYDSDGYIVVNIWNGWGLPIRLASGNGDDSRPAFHLGGSYIVYYDEKTSVVKDDASIDKYDQKLLSLQGEWYQDQSNANNILGKFLAHTVAPKPTSDNIVIAGDLRLQLGDTIRLRDRYGFGEYFDVQIYGITRTFSIDSGLTDNLMVQMVPAGGKWDDTVYGIWESTFVWT
jgi:hypothetical protein